MVEVFVDALANCHCERPKEPVLEFLRGFSAFDWACQMILERDLSCCSALVSSTLMWTWALETALVMVLPTLLVF